MKRKEEHTLFKKSLCILVDSTNNLEREKAKEDLLELQRKDYPLVVVIVKNGYFFDKEGYKIKNPRLIDIINSDLGGYQVPDYLTTIQLIKEHKF